MQCTSPVSVVAYHKLVSGLGYRNETSGGLWAHMAWKDFKSFSVLYNATFCIVCFVLVAFLLLHVFSLINV